MGGSGRYFDRDVAPRRQTRRRTHSAQAERMMSASQMNAACDPKNRRLSCAAETAITLAFDVTGSMGTLPKVFCDKVAMLAGPYGLIGFLKDVHVSLAAIGDAIGDEAPIQICDYVPIKRLDPWLKRIWLEGKGGGNGAESYELLAWFYAHRVDLTKAKNKLLIITGDEDFRDDLPQGDLRSIFGGKLRNSQAKGVFSRLLELYNGNVFLIHRKFHYGDEQIVEHWESVLGQGHVLRLGTDKAVGDVALGIAALTLGGWSLDRYCESMKERKNLDTKKAEPQSPARIKEVRQTLEPLAQLLERTRPKRRRPARQAPTKKKAGGKKKTGRKAPRPLDD